MIHHLVSECKLASFLAFCALINSITVPCAVLGSQLSSLCYQWAADLVKKKNGIIFSTQIKFPSAQARLRSLHVQQAAHNLFSHKPCVKVQKGGAGWILAYWAHPMPICHLFFLLSIWLSWQYNTSTLHFAFAFLIKLFQLLCIQFILNNCVCVKMLTLK